jgi:transcriptional regulator with GAF, ATPase, and Fis domain
MHYVNRLMIWLAVALVAAYSFGVLYHLRTTWDLGLYCLFADPGEQGTGDSGATISWVDAETVAGESPREGDRLLTVAGVKAPTAINLQSRVAAISPPGRAPIQPVISDPSELASLPASVAQADIRGDRWAKIEYLRETAGQEPERHTAWLRLKATPTATILMSLAWFVLEAAILAIGVLVVWKRPGDVSAVTFFALCVVNVVTFMGAFHWVSLIGSALIYPFVFCALLLAPMTLHFYALAPRPVAVMRRWPRATLATIYALPAIWSVLLLVSLLRIDKYFDRGDATALAGSLNGLAALVYRYLAVSVGMFVVGLGVLVYGFLNCRTRDERRQAAWLLGAGMLATLPVGYLLRTAASDRAQFVFGSLPRAMVYVTSLLFTLSYAISITRSKLMQVGRIVNRGILYVGISFAATALFCLMVGLTTALVGTFYFRWENAVAAGLTAMLVVVLLGSIRDRFQRALDRRFYRERYQLDKAMRRLGQAVDQLVEPAQLARQLLESAVDAVGATRGAVYLRPADGEPFGLVCRTNWPDAAARIAADDPYVDWLRRSVHLAGRFAPPAGTAAREATAARWPRQTGDALGCVLELESAVMGLIVLGTKRDAAPYSPEDRNFLVALARTTALALHSAQGHRTIDALNDELKDKVRKIAEQQRRIVFLQSELLGRGEAEAAPHARRTPAAPRDMEHGIRGSSPAIQRLLEQAAKVAQSAASVLVRGESGTGKELLARAIHAGSPRRDGPFVQVNCAALSQSLLESELFGHVKGAFTGADREKIGRFDLADGGTLFLDEIGDVSPETQTRLLRVLQEKSFERVGGVRTVAVDVRLIAATHQNLEELIRRGRFREDLFYRLNVISLWCPPLRERRDDVYELAMHFLRVYARRADKPIAHIRDEALEALAAYSWPGNIRQLENAIERAVVLAEGDEIGRSDLPPEILAGGEPKEAPSPAAARQNRRRARATVSVSAPGASGHGARGHGNGARGVDTTSGGLVDELVELERGRIEQALVRAGGNKSEAARLLTMPRSTLFSKLRKLGME